MRHCLGYAVAAAGLLGMILAPCWGAGVFGFGLLALAAALLVDD